jgi:hypothetical protein
MYCLEAPRKFSRRLDIPDELHGGEFFRIGEIDLD